MPQVRRVEPFGFLQLDPIPDLDELASFYESGYYDQLRSGVRATELARLATDTPDSRLELEWLRETIHRDFIDAAGANLGGGARVLEVGSGRGDLVASFGMAGWQATGLEPARDMAEACRQRGLDVHCSTLDVFLQENPDYTADAVVMRFVLEHVPDPIGLLEATRGCLTPGGTLVVEVPNDFNDLQEASVRKLEADRWWIAAPDHINYFDFDSLTQTLNSLGFQVTARSTTFPMELFLLMGENYIGDPEVGASCHRRRRELELSLPCETRRRLYGALAQAGLGRSCLVTAARR